MEFSQHWKAPARHLITLRQNKLPHKDLWGQPWLPTPEMIWLPPHPPLPGTHTTGASQAQGCCLAGMCIYVPSLPSCGLSNHQTYGNLREMAKSLQKGEPGSCLLSSCSLCLVFFLLEYVVLRENKLKKKVKGTEMWFLGFFWPVGCDAVEGRSQSLFSG